MMDTATITVTGQESLEQIYFLIRVGSWHPEHVDSFLNIREQAAYNQGHEDAHDNQTQYDAGDVDDAYSRGYDAGHNDGYKDGYSDGSREASYNHDNRGDSW